MSLQVSQLQCSVEDQEVLRGFDISVSPGELHVIMGPNGSGKSTVAHTIMGNPKYAVTGGDISLDDVSLLDVSVDERARRGLFLSMQHAPEIPGVTVTNFLRLAVESLTGEKQNPLKFYRALKEKMNSLGIDEEFAKRYVNVGFSGGEKKRLSILQMMMLGPKYVILDEIDSGLDVDALKAVAEGIESFRSEDVGMLLITHYSRILEYVTPDVVHVMSEGKIVKSGGMELVKQIEEHGFESVV